MHPVVLEFLKTYREKPVMANIHHTEDPNKFPNPEEHPYRAYDPSHGWSLAVRLKAGQVMARTILHRFPGKPYTFSRGFRYQQLKPYRSRTAP